MAHANYIASQIVRAAGYDVADIDFLLRIPHFNRFQSYGSFPFNFSILIVHFFFLFFSQSNNF